MFGIFERDGQGWCQMVTDVLMRSLQRVVLERVEPDPVINANRWRFCNRFGEVGYADVRVDRGCDEFVCGEVRCNGIDALRGYARTRRVRFRGLNPKVLSLRLKEREF